MGSLLLSGCVDCNDSVSVSVRDVCGSSAAAFPAATSLSPSRRLMWPSELPAGAVATSIPFIQVSSVRAVDDIYWQDESNHRETNRSVTNFEDALEHDTHPYR